MLITGGFAFALLTAGLIARRSNAEAKAWIAALIVEWLVSRAVGYGLSRDTSLVVGEWTDFALALVAMFRFFVSRGRWWELALVLTWITQIFAHWTFADDIPTMGLWLNILCGAQIALVCSDRAVDAISAMLRPHRYSHGALSRFDRSTTRALRGPDCRSAALRRAIRQSRERA